MSDQIFKGLGGLSLVDKVVDGLRKIGESIQLQDIVDDAAYMAGKYGTHAILNVATRFKIEGNADTIANRGVIILAVTSNPLDCFLVPQVLEKNMKFVVSEEMMEMAVVKSIIKAMGIIGTVEDMMVGNLDGAVFEEIRHARKVIAIVLPERERSAETVKALEKILRFSRDGFSPIIPLGFSGTRDFNLGSEITIHVGEKQGVNQDTKDEEINAMAMDLLGRLTNLGAPSPV